MLVTVTGGSGSGKSAYAEQTAVRLAEGGRLLYLATMMRDGAGAQERIRRHRALRSGKGFLTIEKTDSLCELDPGILQGATVLLEDLSNLAANVFFGSGGETVGKADREAACAACLQDLRYLQNQADNLVVVMNEVFADGIRYEEGTMQYLRLLGALNSAVSVSRHMTIRNLYESLVIAFSTYSSIPMPRVDWNDENMKYTICFFPLIGAVIGGISWLFAALAAALRIGVILRSAVLVLIPLAVTGGIHLDGLLDVADALSSWKPRQERLAIMKDSHCGAFAVIWCCAYFLASFGVFSEMKTSSPSCMAQLLLTYMTARAYSGLALLTFPKAKNTGLLRTFSDRAMNDRGARILTGMLAAQTVLMILMAPVRGLSCSMAGAAVFWLYRRLSEKTFGGITGDLAGCFLCLEELCMAAVIALVG